MLKHIAFISILCAGLVWSQDKPVTPAGPRLVKVNVLVTKDKKPVKGLTEKDFVLEDKGKQQPIATFWVADDAPKASDTLDPAIASNRLDDKRSQMAGATVIVYDRVNNEQISQALIRQAVLKVLSNLKPTDRVGFYSLGLGLTTIRDYTEEAGPLIAAVKAFQANKPDQLKDKEEKALYQALSTAMAPIQELQNQQKVNVTFPVFQAIARHLEGAPGRRNILWITSSFPLTYGGTDNTRRTNDEAEIETFRQVLNNSGVSLYPLNPAGSGQGFAGATLSGQQTLDDLAQSTGGEAYRSVNDLAQPLREIIQNTTYSYVLGFYPDGDSLDDKNHPLRVTLAKKPETDKAKVLHRKDYLAWGAASKSDLAKSSTLEDVMKPKSNIETGIALMTVANVFPPDPTIQTLDIRVGINDIRLVPDGDKWTADLTMGLGLEGKGLQDKWEYKPKLSLEEWQEAQKLGGIEVRHQVQVGAGATGTLRLGVRDNSTGATGTVKVSYGGR